MKREAFERFTSQQLLCGLFYGEARLQESDAFDELREYIAIGQVVMNRKNSKPYPDTIKEVILQPNQFSCFNENDLNNEKIYFFLINQNPLKTYQTMLTVAVGVIGELYEDLVDGATNYAATYLWKEKQGTGHWLARMKVSFVAGGHTFGIVE